MLKWIDETFIKEFFKHDDYTGNKLHWRERMFLGNRANFRLGPARLRQLRIDKGEFGSI